MRSGALTSFPHGNQMKLAVLRLFFNNLRACLGPLQVKIPERACALEIGSEWMFMLIIIQHSAVSEYFWAQACVPEEAPGVQFACPSPVPDSCPALRSALRSFKCVDG